ncbi:MAG: sigma-70 family RNA polymerase sigma factor [Clostridiales bacterium]|jgi:RNA polymerase sigma factor (sigma-70 family)|nr:sigma-70 family RNA polymerase sigma factor [Clostridiales bacterium]
MRLTTEQQRLAETNMGLVGKVIKDCVRSPNQVGIFTYDDLFQIGCLGLCDAARTFAPNRKAKFDTYAYILIRNRIFNQLEYATLRRNRETILEPNDMPEMSDGSYAAAECESELEKALALAEANAAGITAKGIKAIRLQAQGYSCKEIGAQFGGASANNVSAWIFRARKYLLKNPAIAVLSPN